MWLCLEVHHLLLSKYVLARDKDVRFCRAAIVAGYVRRETLMDRLATVPIDEQIRESVAFRILTDFGKS